MRINETSARIEWAERCQIPLLLKEVVEEENCFQVRAVQYIPLKVPKCEILMSWIFMIFFIMKSI